MAHIPQVDAAFDSKTGKYNFDSCYFFMKPLFNEADLIIGNFETTLNGKPYSGYPNFSSPNEFLVSLKNIGVRCLVTANNHTFDTDLRGMVKTLDLMDSLKFYHTGSYRSIQEKSINKPLVINIKGYNFGLLNYTYGLNNGKKINLIDYIDTNQMLLDIEKVKLRKPNKIIVFLHWGVENQTIPNNSQINIAKFLYRKGVDYIIGSHPHVIQRIERKNEKICVYSLGNFISNQRKTLNDGGMMFCLSLKASYGQVSISKADYILTWVHKTFINNQTKYLILPINSFENNQQYFKAETHYYSMKNYINAAKTIMKENIGVEER